MRNPRTEPVEGDTWMDTRSNRVYRVTDLNPTTIQYEGEPNRRIVVDFLGGRFLGGRGLVGDLDGRTDAPTRYYDPVGGRETIDHIRDVFRETYGEEGDRMFAAGCLFQVLRYEARIGKKEGQTPERDLEAARWYQQMLHHVEDGITPDPRTVRGDSFVPYRYRPTRGLIHTRARPAGR